MILGDTCTRACRFCGVKKADKGVDIKGEAERIEAFVKQLNPRFVVITSVTRDDLDDYGVSHFCDVVLRIKSVSPDTAIELLIPDFMGDSRLLKQVAGLPVAVLGHNMETVERLYPLVRPRTSCYRRSLDVLASLKRLCGGGGPLIKTAIMLGLGEADDEVFRLIDDIASVGADALAIGQYLCPLQTAHKVVKYYNLEDFLRFKEYAAQKGIKHIWSGELVRSSFVGEELYGG